jgi:hypothetical protein
MVGYRAFIIGPDGHVTNRIEFQSPDDRAAMEQAEAFVDGHDVEVWLEERRVGKIAAENKWSSSTL